MFSNAPVHHHGCGELPSATTTSPNSETVHPHVCGELVPQLGAPALSGRFTPTCVGNCHTGIIMANSKIGSPPRVWGIDRCQCAKFPATRFTPTCVGNCAELASITDNGIGSPPRVWGIGTTPPTRATNARGSPPRVWGIGINVSHQIIILRFTPTCVGNWWCWPRIGVSETVHPHVCGELKVHLATGDTGYGSPPRVWGIGWVAVSAVVSPRFTPTCVGNW